MVVVIGDDGEIERMDASTREMQQGFRELGNHLDEVQKYLHFIESTRDRSTFDGFKSAETSRLARQNDEIRKLFEKSLKVLGED